MAQGVAALTDREREVLQLLLAGHTAKTIAAELDLSVHTVNDYLREARRKLGVSSSREAARILGEQEETAPQNPATAQIGMGEGERSGDPAKPSGEAGPDRRLPWLIGGLLMLAIAIAAALTLTSTASHESAEREVEAQFEEFSDTESTALAWVQLIDAGDYAQSWAEAGPTFRSSVTADLWATQAGAVREPLGDTITRTVKSVDERETLPGAPEGPFRIVTFDTDFGSASGSTETVVLRQAGGEWGVVGYFIR